MVLVHNLVKRYSTKESSKKQNSKVETRASEGNSTSESEFKQNDEKSGDVTAIKGTSFGVKTGEILSLIGINGAGKSSTLNCMAAYQRASGGKIKLDGIDIDSFFNNPTALHGLLGYCPQTNVNNNLLTVRQHLTLFARLTGIEKASLTDYVTSTIARFGLSASADTQAKNLSGGNRRKLTLAMAMIGQPKIVFADEASTGVDPFSRRTIQRAILHEGKNSAVIVTTHSMEEAETISSKIAIQVDGFIRSFGTLKQILRADGQGQECYFIDFNIDLKELLSRFEVPDQRMTRERDLIERRLSEWSA